MLRELRKTFSNLVEVAVVFRYGRKGRAVYVVYVVQYMEGTYFVAAARLTRAVTYNWRLLQQ